MRSLGRLKPWELNTAPPWPAAEGGGVLGLTVTVGYSVGGWGHRKNLVDFSGEVCQPCFEGIGPTMAEVFAQVKRHQAGEPRQPIPRATVVNVMKTAVRAAKKRWGNR